MHPIATFCKENGLRLNTDLGQHFLIDEKVLQSIVEAADIQRDDHILEVGPGIGVLTAELLKKAGKVMAIEIDQKLIPLLNKFTADRSPLTADRLAVQEGNALKTPFPESPYKLVANIPYHITTPLLYHAFLESKQTPTSVTLLIQKEVAERICEEKDRGQLTVLVQLFGTPKVVRKVKPSAFLPPPAVDSAVLHIAPHPEPLADAETIREVMRLAKIAFGKKRKMLRNTIGELDGGMKLLEKARIEETRRPQTLEVREWISLAQN